MLLDQVWVASHLHVLKDAPLVDHKHSGQHYQHDYDFGHVLRVLLHRVHVQHSLLRLDRLFRLGHKFKYKTRQDTLVIYNDFRKL